MISNLGEKFHINQDGSLKHNQRVCYRKLAVVRCYIILLFFLGSIIELDEKQQNMIEASKEDNEEVELSKNEVAMETVEINWTKIWNRQGFYVYSIHLIMSPRFLFYLGTDFCITGWHPKKNNT